MQGNRGNSEGFILLSTLTLTHTCTLTHTHRLLKLTHSGGACQSPTHHFLSETNQRHQNHLRTSDRLRLLGYQAFNWYRYPASDQYQFPTRHGTVASTSTGTWPTTGAAVSSGHSSFLMEPWLMDLNLCLRLFWFRRQQRSELDTM